MNRFITKRTKQFGRFVLTRGGSDTCSPSEMSPPWSETLPHITRTRPSPAAAESVEAHVRLGCAHRAQGRFHEALAHLARALEVGPHHRRAHEEIGFVYLIIDRVEMAERHLAALRRMGGESCVEARSLAVLIAAYRAESPERDASPLN